MPDRDAILRALHCRGQDLMIDLPPCDQCEYQFQMPDRGGCDFWRLCRDAAELLKDQEARVMTLDEVKAFDWDYCYLEEERLPGKEYRSVCGDYALTCITWPCIASMRIQHGDDSYGTKWRCWSAKPTDEQRQAVKWE